MLVVQKYMDVKNVIHQLNAYHAKKVLILTMIIYAKKYYPKSELTSAQICGIVIGCVGVILIFAFTVLFLSRKSNFSKVKLDTNSSKYEGNKNTDEGYNMNKGINKSSDNIVKTEEKK